MSSILSPCSRAQEPPTFPPATAPTAAPATAGSPRSTPPAATTFRQPSTHGRSSPVRPTSKRVTAVSPGTAATSFLPAPKPKRSLHLSSDTPVPAKGSKRAADPAFCAAPDPKRFKAQHSEVDPEERSSEAVAAASAPHVSNAIDADQQLALAMHWEEFDHQDAGVLDPGLNDSSATGAASADAATPAPVTAQEPTNPHDSQQASTDDSSAAAAGEPWWVEEANRQAAWDLQQQWAREDAAAAALHNQDPTAGDEEVAREMQQREMDKAAFAADPASAPPRIPPMADWVTK